MADATAATTPKIEELRARLKADPKSRHFFPLAEELRKFHQLEQAEEILREGIQGHPSYLSAWISLGRVLRDRGREHEAVEVLKRALVLDGGNVVAAKLLAQAYLGVGDKIEAIKKFKLVYALMPSDTEVEAEIDRLDREINPDNYGPPAEVAQPHEPVDASAGEERAPFAMAAESVGEPGSSPSSTALLPSSFDLTDSHPFSLEEEPLGSTAEGALSSLLEPQTAEAGMSSSVAEPSAALVVSPAAEASPFESEAVAEPEPFGELQAVGDFPAQRAVLEPEAEEPHLDEEPSEHPAAVPATLTMAQLFERQGHDEQAAAIYRQILEQEPENVEARNALARSAAESGSTRSELTPALSKGERIRRLETWRARVART